MFIHPFPPPASVRGPPSRRASRQNKCRKEARAIPARARFAAHSRIKHPKKAGAQPTHSLRGACVAACFLRLLLSAATKLQPATAHAYGRSPVCVRRWLARWWLVVAA